MLQCIRFWNLARGDQQIPAANHDRRKDIPMNTTLTTASQAGTAVTKAPRVVSIDIFRGLTMAVMIFVNQLSDVRGLAWWTYHAHAQEDVMTYVDMVFPFFLFVVGMSMPLSVAQRLKRNPSLPALWLHVLLRVLGLLVLGLILANAKKCDPVQMRISGSLWALLALLCAGLYLNVYEKSDRFPAYPWILRFIGLFGVVALLAIFRRATPDGHSAWIDFSYPEILGLIALSYLAVSILYIPTRRWVWMQPVWFVLLVSLCVFSTARILAFPNRVSLYFWPFGNGAMACIIMAGVITSLICVGSGSDLNPRRAIGFAACFGLLTLAAGRVLTPLGISKIRATPAWSLYSIGAAVLIFALLYWVCDVKQWTGWAFFARPAGENTLTTYLLPDLWYFLSISLGITFIDTHFVAGWPAVVKTFAFTFFILGVSWALTKSKVRLQF
jgi:heparan-alpha-glucosaminide N-acetyltransferase